MKRCIELTVIVIIYAAVFYVWRWQVMTFKKLEMRRYD